MLLITAFPGRLPGQCDPEADFTTGVNGCTVECFPSYNDPGTVASHQWTFQMGSAVSTSNIANPLHTFESGSASRTVTHTIVINLPGGSQIIRACTKQLNYNCANSCNENTFNYDVNACAVAFAGLVGGTQLWDFGDGTPATTTNNPTHAYASDGDYVVTFTLNNHLVCQKYLRVACGIQQPCCAEFAAALSRECSVLWLKLESDCGGGIHKWTVAAEPSDACFTLAGFNPAIADQTVQLTNINTTQVTALIVKHEYTCSDGSKTTATQTLSTGNLDGIYIGMKQTPSSLKNDYECVLPASAYNGSTVVYSSGIVRIDKAFEFAAADVRMHPEAGFDVEPDITFTLRLATTVRGAPDCNCLWRGIAALPGATLATGSNAVIRDALYAVRALGGSNLSLRETTFNGNFIGIRISEGIINFPDFQQNNFDGTGPLKDICGLAPQNDIFADPIALCSQAVPYLTDRGFAGLYVRNAGLLNLPTLAYNQHTDDQNHFFQLAVGIDIYDTEASIRRNCRFQNIQPGAYALSGATLLGGVAVRFADTELAGPNGIRFTGNGKYTSGLAADFDDCAFGIYVSSQVTAGPNSGTRVGVSGCRILKAQNGVFLSNNCGVGTFSGNSNSIFRGVNDNYIQVAPAQQFNGVAPMSGILHTDFTSTVSDLELQQNSIDVDQASATGSNTYGIGLLGFDIGAPDVFQTNINRNEINVNQGFFGINTTNYRRAWIHDNNAQAAANGGVYVNASGGVGIQMSGAAGNLVACNDVIAAASGVQNLRVQGHGNSLLSRNLLANGQRSAVFRLNCGDSRFACNTMQDYSENGLRYEFSAVTGPQGDAAKTHGNAWLTANPALTGAYIASGINPALSQYYVRNLAIESPSNNGMANWFFPNVPLSVIPTCYLDCPVSSPNALATDEITAWDDSVAQQNIEYGACEAANRWWSERNLLEKLRRNPSLMNGKPPLEPFVAALENTPLDRLLQAEEKTAELTQLPAAEAALLESRMAELANILPRMETLDSLLRTTGDAAWVAERDSLAQRLDATQTELAVIEQQLTIQRLTGVDGVLAFLNGITPGNIYEENEKIVLSIYLRSVVSGLMPAPDMLDSLKFIGSKCPLEHGPAAYRARSLYDGFTGAHTPEVECAPAPENRAAGGSQNPSIAVRYYPNPASDRLIVEAANLDPGVRYRLRLSNLLGKTVQDVALTESAQALPTACLPAGVYFMSLYAGNARLYQAPVILQR